MVIANMNPLVVLYYNGFLRVTLKNYNITDYDPSGHITNTALAKEFLKNQNISFADKENALKEQMWTYEQLEKYLVSNGKVKKN
jgi:Tubulin-tyrosine ligase family.